MNRPRWICILGLVALALVACGEEDDPCQDAACGGAGPTGGQGGEGGDGGAGGMTTSLPAQYCDCMLLTCHDAYHASFGPDTDEPAAAAACLAEAEGLPSVGMDIDMGNSIECRLHYCALGSETPDDCAAAVGDGACAP
jgi:hypothetical protein